MTAGKDKNGLWKLHGVDLLYSNSYIEQMARGLKHRFSVYFQTWAIHNFNTESAHNVCHINIILTNLLSPAPPTYFMAAYMR